MEKMIFLQQSKSTSYPNSGSYLGGGVNYVFQHPTDKNTYYYFASVTGADPYYYKTTDRGKTWTLSSALFNKAAVQWSCWYDRWSGLNSDLVHFAYTDSGTDDVYYTNVDISTDTALGSEYTIWAGASTATPANMSITRTRGGNLIICGQIDAGAEKFARKSTDVGVNWSDISSPVEATTDQIIMLPGFAADNQDAIAIYWDASANEISRKVYDDSANSWAETSIATSMVARSSSSDFPNFSACVDLTNSQVYMAAWSATDTASASYKCFKLSESSITEVTAIVSSSTDDQGLSSICIDEEDATHLVAFYFGSTDGNDVHNNMTGPYYKESFDSGSTWGSETRIEFLKGASNGLFGTARFTTMPIILTSSNTTADLMRTSAPISKIKSFDGQRMQLARNPNDITI